MKHANINKLVTLALLLSLTSCDVKDDNSYESIVTFKDTTIYGYIESIEDETLLLSLGSLINLNGSMDDSFDPNLNKNEDIGQIDNQNNPPEIPSGDNQNNTSDMPSGNGENNPPEIPSGDNQNNTSDMPSGNGENNPPEIPSGNNQENPPEIPSGDNQNNTSDIPNIDNLNTNYFYKSTTQAIILVSNENLIYDNLDNVIKLEGLSVSNILEITIDSNSAISKIKVLDVSLFDTNNLNPNMQDKDIIPGGQSSNIEYNALNTYSSDASFTNETYTSTAKDEEAILVKDGASVTFNNITLTRTSDDSTGGDNSSFYGVGAGILVVDGTSYINGGSINTDAKGGAGAFSYNKGTIYIAGCNIVTKESTSGGIHVAGGGSLYAYDLNVQTSGESSAAIRSDRGGGTMVVDGGTYITNGEGSPSVYCTATIAVNNANLKANNSEAICIEGENDLYIYNSSISGNMKDNSQNDTTWTFIVYQSMSGDSEVGCSTLHIKDSNIESLNGGLFYVTNTECSILLENSLISTSEDSEFLLQCTGNNNARGWGSAGKNGANCNFTARKQTLSGNIIWDLASTLDLYLVDNTNYDGMIFDDESWASNATNGYCNVYLDESSTWIVKGNSIVSNLYNAGVIKDANNKKVSILNSKGEVLVLGDSEYSITVLNNYSETLNVLNAISTSSFEAFQIEKPSELN